VVKSITKVENTVVYLVCKLVIHTHFNTLAIRQQYNDKHIHTRHTVSHTLLASGAYVIFEYFTSLFATGLLLRGKAGREEKGEIEGEG